MVCVEEIRSFSAAEENASRRVSSTPLPILADLGQNQTNWGWLSASIAAAFESKFLPLEIGKG